MSSFDKSTLFSQIKAHIEAELATLSKSVDAAAEAATHEESKPENKYDTFGLEASYLAGAQKERLSELQATLHMLRNMDPRSFTDADRIMPTALVELESSGVLSHCLLLILGPGYRLKLGEHEVLTITTHSPLGRSLLGKTVGDIVTIKTQQGAKEYEIISLK